MMKLTDSLRMSTISKPESEFCSGCRSLELFITTPLKNKTKTAEPSGSTVKVGIQGNDIYLKIFKM
ncbi:hypothetical protein DVQ88_08445 [Yersinia enterocolitica]|nr:hypothetical protein [Yersinia enterocolitica]